ncbi:MAG: VOC family protein [Cyanobacteria bacterium J06635_13]
MTKLTQILFFTLVTPTVLFTSLPNTLAQTEPSKPKSIYPLLQIEAEEELMDLVQEVEMVGITVSDMERAIAFYTDVLSFTKISDVEVQGEEYEKLLGSFGVRLRLVQMQLGTEKIELIQHLTPQGETIPADSDSNDPGLQHIAIVVADMSQAYQKLQEFDVTHVPAILQQQAEYIEAATGTEAFYVRDPDGNTLELIHFPPGKGDPRWQNPTERLFMGIDHTAIAISDTETSRQFYQNILGLEFVGESENYGTEQEHLSSMREARLKITDLQAEQGIGIEFLEYLQPQQARPILADTSPQNLIHWQTTLVVEDTNMVAEKLLYERLQFVSEALVNITEPELGFSRGFMVRDPDGHVLRIVEKQ